MRWKEAARVKARGRVPTNAEELAVHEVEGSCQGEGKGSGRRKQQHEAQGEVQGKASQMHHIQAHI